MDAKMLFFVHARPSMVDPARRQEKADSRLINEDYTAVANLPRHEIISYFPRSERFNNAWPHYDDMIGGN